MRFIEAKITNATSITTTRDAQLFATPLLLAQLKNFLFRRNRH